MWRQTIRFVEPGYITSVKRIWTIVGVKDVAHSVEWYQSLFGQPKTPPSHGHFSQILDSDGTVLLSIHQWGEHEHPSLMSPDTATPGNGLLLFFGVDDFDSILVNARGERFADESESYKVLGYAVLSQPGRTAFQIFDSVVRARS